MSAQSKPLWPPAKKRRIPHPHLPRLRIDPQDRAAIRTVGVYSIAAVLAGLAITVLIMVVCLWVKLAIWVL